MILNKVTIRNFRCYSNATTIDIGNLTCIIGKNDVGKSTVMEALDAFFNDTISKADLSATAPVEDQNVEIICVFSELPESLILDTSAQSNLDEEGLLNVKKELEIKRVWDFSGKTVSKATFLHCNYYDAPEADGLLSKKKDSLKAFLQNNAISLLPGGKITINRDMRQAIRSHFQMTSRSEKYIKVDGSLGTEDNIKSIWKGISSQLPIYALFKMDRMLSDKDGNVQDPMKLAIEQALKVDEIQQKLRDVEDYVRLHTTQIADATIQKLANFDSKLAERLQASFTKECKWGSVFDIALLNEKNIPLNKRGSGIRRLVLLSFFQAQAEAKKDEKGSPAIIYAIEEPETSQHPEHQLEIIHSLVALAEQQATQLIFTTHSANLVCEIPIESIRYIDNDPELLVKSPILDDGTKDDRLLSLIIKKLGILPSPTDKVKVLLYLEGNNDVSALKEYSKLLFENGVIEEDIMASDKIGIVISGGSSLSHYINNKYLDGLGKPAVHIYDNDKQEYRCYVANINSEENPAKKAFNTSKLEMENFLCKEAIEEAYADNGITVSIPVFDDQADVPTLVCKSNNKDWDSFDDKKKKSKESKVKSLLNTQAVAKMTVERLEAKGVKQELKTWFDTLIEYSK